MMKDMPRPVKQPVVFEALTYQIIGLAYSIHKELGWIHKESIYQKALETELKEHSIVYIREARLPVLFKGKNIGVYIPDFVIDGKLIIEIKAMEYLPIKSSVQLSYYLKTTGYRVGLLLNFGIPKLQVQRRIYG